MYLLLNQVSMTLTKRLATLTMRQYPRHGCGHPTPKNAYRLPNNIFNCKSIFLPVKLVSMALTIRSPTPTTRHYPHPLPKMDTTDQTVFFN